MLKPIFFFSLFAVGFAFAAEEPERPVEDRVKCSGPHHARAAIRHIEAGGIGYTQGYTTLETFVSADPYFRSFLPFLDLRAHFFNNRKFAVNAGIGFRKMRGCRAYGFNAYYDYRSGKKNPFNQVGIGLETLGNLWDLRFNAYIPVGTTTSKPYHPTFGGFKGNSILVDLKYQYAMTGGDGELGFHFGKTSDFDFYAAAGPYYFKGHLGSAAAGGKARIAAYYKEYAALEISDSYDNVFHNHFQGQLTLTLPLGPRARAKRTTAQCPDTCAFAEALANRMVQPVGRQEIIVLDKGKKGEPASNFILFVDNLSHSDGTYESPYSTLVAAQDASSPGDIIYVFPGDGTTTGMDAGISLQAGQSFWGSGVSHAITTNLGTIVIPAQTATTPMISNSGGDGIDLATDNQISGFTIAGTSSAGISGNNPGNLSILSSTVLDSAVQGIVISVSSGSSSIEIADVIVQNSVNNGIEFDVFNTGVAAVTIANSSITDSENQGVEFNINDTATVTATVSNNTISNTTGSGLDYSNASDSASTLVLTMQGNTFQGNSRSLQFDYSGSSTSEFYLLENSFTLNQSSLSFSSSSSSIVNGTFDGNTISETITDHGLLFENQDTSQVSLTFSNNTISYNADDGIYLPLSGTEPIALVFENNTFIGNGGQGVEFSIPHSIDLSMVNNTFAGNHDSGVYFDANSGSTTDSLVVDISSNIFDGNFQAGLSATFSGATTQTTNAFTASSNTATSNGTYGIILTISNTGSTGTLTTVINDNTIAYSGSIGMSIYPQSTEAGFDIPMTVSGNTVTNTFGQGIQFSASENANFTVAFDDNTSSYNEDAAFSFSTSDVATVCLEMSGNNFNPGYSISYYSTGAFTFAPCDYETVNTGSFSFSGGPVTYIESCPDGAPCP